MSQASCDLVTGGTGMLGSHIAERLVAAGRHVRALVRPNSRTDFLKGLGVELVEGDLTDPGSCARAVEGVDVVYHAAAKVGDWGAWHEFQTCCIDATKNLAEAAALAGVGRFLHISSTSAYGHPADGGPPIDETAPMGQNVWVWDPYTRSKVESERVLWAMSDRGQLGVTIIRPSWLYGERDRTTTARIVERLKRGQVRIIGPGDNPLSAVYVGTVAESALLAARDPHSAGEAYNITNQGRITQREFMNLFAEAAGVPHVRRHVPYRIAYAASFLLEASGRLAHSARPPLITRYGTWLLGRYLEYSTAKAESRLGWRPALSYRESIGRTVRWYLETEGGRKRSQWNSPREGPPVPREPIGFLGISRAFA
ncbi:MAG: NAD-dependent epimerase/dehydratase family protein [Isosphaeraceae bacterium]|nr:NAD-dependent epimerase/dehydratase family protein [Isosphaeraceae bacterium]